MLNSPKRRHAQEGVVLLEALIAILIFSLGILAIVGMQTVAVKQTTDARYRSEACLLVNQLLGTMWVSDRTPATLQASFASPGGPGFTAWLGTVNTAGTVAGTLPGVDANPPTVFIDGTGKVTVSVSWLAPSELAGAAPHQYVATAQIR